MNLLTRPTEETFWNCLISSASINDPDVKEKFYKLPENCKLMSPDIQNDLLEVSKQEFLETMKSEVKEASVCHIGR